MRILKLLFWLAVLAGLLLLPLKGGRILDAVKEKFAKAPAEIKADRGIPAKVWNEAKDAAEGTIANAKDGAENLVKAKDHYLEGLKYFQNGNYEKARTEWEKAAKYAPADPDIKNGLKRIKAITSK